MLAHTFHLLVVVPDDSIRNWKTTCSVQLNNIFLGFTTCKKANAKMCRETQTYCKRDSPPVYERKTVRFSEEENTTHLILNRAEMTMEEFLTSFFTVEEYAAMRLRDKMIARYRCSSGACQELGLESRSDRFLRKQRINECCVSVLLEQELQNTTEESKQTSIAEALRGYSIQSAKLAFHRAYKNAIQVHNVCQWVSHDVKDDVDPRDRPSSPTSTTDLLHCDHESQLDVDQIILSEKWIDFIPPQSLMPSRQLPHAFSMPYYQSGEFAGVPPAISMVDSAAGPIHYYHPLPHCPWVELWAHQQAHHVAHGPIHHTHWYIA